MSDTGAQREMTPEELVANGYPANFHSLSREEMVNAIQRREETRERQRVQQAEQRVKQSRDKAQYVRQQKGHSLIKHLLLGWIVAYVPTIYYAVSPNHYFHA